MLYTTKITKIFAQVNIADYRYMGFLLAYKENKCLKGQASAAEVAVAEAAWGITLPLALKEQMMLTALRIILLACAGVVMRGAVKRWRMKTAAMAKHRC